MKQKFSVAMSLAVILAMLLTSLVLAANVQNHVNADPPPADTTPPIITPFTSGILSDTGWFTSDVGVWWSVVDDESTITSTTDCGSIWDPIWVAVDTTGVTLTCSATSAGGTSSDSVTIRRDATTPTIYGSTLPAPNEYGWNNTDATATFTCDDYMSGIMYCEGDWFFNYEGIGLGHGNARAVDYAWNDERISYGINIDKTPPTVSLVGGPADGGTYFFGLVPAAPTCSASDALSGLDGSCSVSGYGTTIGTHTVTARAADKAGNSASASASYIVRAWSLSGFYAPVEMNGVYNVIRSGSLVPLKFEVFAGQKELTNTSVVQSFTAALVACPAGTDAGAASATGDMVLRYDTTAGRFILSWQTPRQAGACYRVTMMTQDGSSLVAFFRLR
jgi:hypothetical protein